MPFWVRRPVDVAGAPDLEAAYEAGRRDEAARKKRHPIFMAGLFVLAIAGASLITLAAINGSFSGGGEVADRSLNTAADEAAPVVQDAVARTGDAARDAGSAIKEKARDITKPDEKG